MLINFCFLCGVVLSFRFRVSILIPATLIAWLMALVGGLLMKQSMGAIVIEIILLSAILQIGYLTGTVATAGVVALRRSRRSNWLKRPATAP